MRKKIVCILLSIVFAFGMTGCVLFEHNYEADYQQVIAEIRPITETRNNVPKKNDDGTPMLDADGNPMFDDQITFTPEKQVIYKSELISLANSQLSSLLQNNSGMTVQQGVERLYEQLILQKLVLTEAEYSIAFREIIWGMTEDNLVRKTVYNSIDTQLDTLRNDIREERGEETQDSAAEEEDDASTTYPVPGGEEPEDVRDTEKWEPSVDRYPGLYGDVDKISLDNQAMARFIQLLKDNVESDFRVTDEQKKEFNAEFKEMDNIINTKGMAYVYPYLGETKVVDWLLGTTVRNNLKLTLLQEFLTESATVSDAAVLDKFESLKAEQKTSYDGDYSAYKTAITSTSSTTPILYHPDSNYFYVKHVLIPFSDAQTAALKAYKEDKTHSKEEIEAYRKQLVNGIVAYAHKDGEDDKSREYTAEEIFNEIVGSMKRYEGNPAMAYLAEQKFEEFIFKFNTDPGIFNNAKGYSLPYKLADGENDTYMAEFAAGARKMYETLEVGSVLDEMVITDYGVHVMYFASKTKTGFVNIRDTETPGSSKTYFDIIKEMQETSLQNTRFTEWQQTRIAYYDKLSADDVPESERVIVRYTKRFDDLYKD